MKTTPRLSVWENHCSIFAGEMIANRRANLMGSDRGDRLGRALRSDRADRQDLGRRSDNRGERGQYLGVDARVLDFRHFAIFSRCIGVGTENYFAVSLKSTRSSAIGQSRSYEGGPIEPGARPNSQSRPAGRITNAEVRR
jgi:hypothetical protein